MWLERSGEESATGDGASWSGAGSRGAVRGGRRFQAVLMFVLLQG